MSENNFAAMLKDKKAWFNRTVPLDVSESKILYEGNCGFYNVEITFHLVDGTEVIVNNKALESWKADKWVGDHITDIGDDYLEIDDADEEINNERIIPFSAIAYVTSKYTDIDWATEIAKKEQEESKVRPRPAVQGLWHTADEKPEGDDNHILIQFKGKVVRFTVFQVKELQDWKGYTDPMFIERWCYIEDILPKEGASDETKG